jgi:hypothetical protein
MEERNPMEHPPVRVPSTENTNEQMEAGEVDPFWLVQDLADRGNEEAAVDLVHNLRESGMLPELFYEHRFEGMTAEEAERYRDIARFKAALQARREDPSERSHGPFERAVVLRAMSDLSEKRRLLGLSRRELSEGTLRLLDWGRQRKTEGEGGIDVETQEVFAAAPSDFSLLKFAYHELAHLNSFAEMTMKKTEDGVQIAGSRMGLSESVRDNNGVPTRMLGGLNEALTEELARRFLLSLSDDDEDFKEVISSRNARVAKYIATSGDNFSPQDKDEIVDIHELPTGEEYPAYFTYRTERAALRLLIAKIAEREEDGGTKTENTRDDVFEEFLGAAMTGDNTSLRMRIDSVFGDGTFAEMKTDSLADGEKLLDFGKQL